MFMLMMCYNIKKYKEMKEEKKNMQKYKNKQKWIYSEAVIQEHVGGICGKRKRKVKQMDV